MELKEIIAAARKSAANVRPPRSVRAAEQLLSAAFDGDKDAQERVRQIVVADALAAVAAKDAETAVRLVWAYALEAYVTEVASAEQASEPSAEATAEQPSEPSAEATAEQPSEPSAEAVAEEELPEFLL